jgi:hypothetical protein
MGIVIQSVANYAPWIYAICGLVALYQLYRVWLVRAERKQAVFSLEREKAVRDTYNILAIALVLLISMGFTYFISNTLAEAVQPLVTEALAPAPPLPFMPTPTNTPLSVTPTPMRTPTPIGAASDSEPTDGTAEVEEVVPDVTVEPVEEAPTATPAPVVLPPSCPDQRSLLIRPGENEVLRGIVNIIGTANHESFQYYKIEAAAGAGASGGFVYVGGGSAPVSNGVLASIETSALNNGAWTLRLIVVDQTGNFPPPCQVTVTVQN